MINSGNIGTEPNSTDAPMAAMPGTHLTDVSQKHLGNEPVSPPPERPDEFSAIERAVNDAARRANAAWLSLVFLLTYVVIGTGMVTPKDLFLESPVRLPLVGVEVPLRWYFICVPAFILAVHFYFSVQLLGLHEKFREYDLSLLRLEEDETRQN